MAYRFKAKESVSKNVQRIVLEEAESAASLLQPRPERERDEAVHETRKSIKKIRGLLRLLKGELGKTYRTENGRLREAGHRLSPLRDAAALLEVVQHLERQGGATQHAALARVRPGLEQQKNEIEKDFASGRLLEGAAATLWAIARRSKKWRLSNDGFAVIAPGLLWSYRRGRRARKLARKKQNAVSYHTLRKRVKDHWYQIRLLESAWTDVMQAHEASLKDLETWLGEDHNLSVLSAKLKADPDLFGGEQTVRPVLALIRQSQQELREKSLSLADRVYAEKPRAFLRNIGALWEAWQKQPKSMKSTERSRRERHKTNPRQPAA